MHGVAMTPSRIRSAASWMATSYQADWYTYTVDTWDVNGQPDGNFRGTATGDIDPMDPVLDIIIIENRLRIVQ